ncbi:hypothetical protein [Rhizobium binae]|uniref:hypothetical protein n=1 Tax=Rhizobium binae TaxID=1138190 RepID=UPI002180CA8A|nr:hypothetical protein [Rhizobium binae]
MMTFFCSPTATVKYLTIFTALTALLYLPRIPLPVRLGRLVTLIAISAFPTCLLHRFVPELLLPRGGGCAAGSALPSAGDIRRPGARRHRQQGGITMARGMAGRAMAAETA